MPPEFLSDVSPASWWGPHQADGRLWVADAHGRRLGFLGALIDHERLHIEQLQVLRQHQGRGIGRRLLAAAVEAARARGLGSVTLTTFRSVRWNAPFYASAGFVETEPGDMPAGLAAVVAHEQALGWPDRCAMTLAL